MPALPSLQQRRLLGDFVRARRERLTPEACGFPRGARRRTPGLRREEAAQLCGMSATWLTWIEQGREISVAPQALARLADALQMTPAERAYLFELGRKRDPAGPAETEASAAPAALAAALAAMALPAYVLDRVWDVRAWNPPAARLFAPWLDWPGDRNLLRFIFLERRARRLIADWEERARRVTAEFRAEYSRHLEDPATHALIAALCRESAVFARLWAVQAVLGREGGERRFNHPQDGLLRYEQLSFTLSNRPELKLVLLTPMPPQGQAATVTRRRRNEG